MPLSSIPLLRLMTKSHFSNAVMSLIIWNLLWELVIAPIMMTHGNAQYPNPVVLNWLLRGVLLVYLLAFWSVHVQAPGLSSELGLFPLQPQLQSLELWVAHATQQHNPLLLLLTRTTLLLLSPQSLASLSHTCIYVALVGLLYPHCLVFTYLYICYYAVRR